jgi:predicted 3-demethylubiquinone-9 3-methyltransferase (glyoxalase superfamily)
MDYFANYPRISPFLWFDQNADEAVEFYLSIFKNSRRLGEERWPEGCDKPAGTLLTVSFELDGQKFTAINAGPEYKFNEAVSFFVRCDSQAEVDEYWEKLLADGGSEIACGWLRDKFGLVWQVIPLRLLELIKNPKAMMAMMAMMQMKKIDLAELERAAKE